VVFLAKEKMKNGLLIYYYNGIFITEFHTGKTAMTFVTVCGSCFVLDQFVNFAGAAVDAFAATIAFIFVNTDMPHGGFLQTEVARYL